MAAERNSPQHDGWRIWLAKTSVAALVSALVAVAVNWMVGR
jgi:hypothetical protein